MWLIANLAYLLIRGIHKPQDGIVFETLKQGKRWLEMINRLCGPQVMSEVVVAGISEVWHGDRRTWWGGYNQCRAVGQGRRPLERCCEDTFWVQKEEQWSWASRIIVLSCLMPAGFLGKIHWPIIVQTNQTFSHILLLPGLWVVYIRRST